MTINKETLKKVSPIVVGVVIAAAGVLVAFGVLKPTVKQVVPVAVGQKVEFVAGTNAIMVNADVKVIINGTNYISGDCWVLYRMTPPASVVPEVPVVSKPEVPMKAEAIPAKPKDVSKFVFPSPKK